MRPLKASLNKLIERSRFQKTFARVREIDNIERTALGKGMSLALVHLVGLLLNHTPWGIRLAPVTLSLHALTTILTIVRAGEFNNLVKNGYYPYFMI